jgi:benzoyl-CoA reductase/2-hydroxyglutaryl-CoA dehydratase subunit BcrC/BadD/HgdB
MYTELLKLCGFEPDEIEKERPRVDRAFEKLEMGPADIEQAEKRVTQYFDTSLVGVRKSLGIWMKQLIDLVLAREEGKKVVYPSYPNIPMVGLALNLASDEVYCQSPEVVLDVAVGQILGKIDPILEAAEAHGLPPGVGMCALNQARVGGIVKGIIPVPDLMIPSGSFCDQTPKVDDMLHELYGVPSVCIDGVMDAPWEEYPDMNPRRVKYFGAEIRRAIDETEQALGIDITDEMLEMSLGEMVRLYYALVGLWEFMKNDPVPVSQSNLGPLFWMLSSPERRSMAEGFDAVAKLTLEVKQRVDEGRGVVDRGAPRVLVFCHHVTDPAVTNMIEGQGLAIALTSFASITQVMASSFMGVQYTTFEDKAADRLLAFGVYHSASSLIHRYKELCQTWQVDGMINLYPFSCRPLAIHPLMAKKAIEDELGIPVLALEGDMYDTRNYSPEALRTRVEAFAELLKVRKAAAVG